MKYIEKALEPMSLTSIKRLSNKNVKISFDSLPENVIKDLTLSLLQDQGHLCCYCQDTIDDKTAYLTHFYPREFFKDEELNYSNMFLTCSHARGLPPKQQHCDMVKQDQLIPKYMSDERCTNFFRYNTLGEIVPANTFRTIKQCRDNFHQLTAEQQTILSAIEVLNLNADRLKELRKAILTQLMKLFDKIKKEKVLQEAEKYKSKEKDGRYKRFCEVIVYYLKTIASLK